MLSLVPFPQAFLFPVSHFISPELTCLPYNLGKEMALNHPLSTSGETYSIQIMHLFQICKYPERWKPKSTPKMKCSAFLPARSPALQKLQEALAVYSLVGLLGEAFPRSPRRQLWSRPGGKGTEGGLRFSSSSCVSSQHTSPWSPFFWLVWKQNLGTKNRGTKLHAKLD